MNNLEETDKFLEASKTKFGRNRKYDQADYK